MTLIWRIHSEVTMTVTSDFIVCLVLLGDSSQCNYHADFPLDSQKVSRMVIIWCFHWNVIWRFITKEESWWLLNGVTKNNSLESNIGTNKIIRIRFSVVFVTRLATCAVRVGNKYPFIIRSVYIPFFWQLKMLFLCSKIFISFMSLNLWIPVYLPVTFPLRNTCT